jgi:hypothetical protein
VEAPLIAAGVLGLVAAAVHGAGGHALVVRRLAPEQLPPTRFGGPRMTLRMIQASWHLATVGFLTGAAGLLLAGTVLDGAAAEAAALVAAGGVTGFAAVTIVAAGNIHALTRHPAAVLLTTIAALAWWGALTV